MPKEREKLQPRDWNEGFGENSEHGAEHPRCIDCAYRKIWKLSDGKIIDTGKGPTCEAYPVLKPWEVLSQDNAECPKYKPDKREKNL